MSDDAWNSTGLYYNVFRWYEPGTGRYASSDPLVSERSLRPYVYVDANPEELVDPLGLVSSSADCGKNCCPLAMAREQSQIQNWLQRNGQQYRKPWLEHFTGRRWGYGCGDAADGAVGAIEREVMPKCWITRSQMLALGNVAVLSTYVVVHFVPTFRPCGSHGAPQDDLYADPWHSDYTLQPLSNTSPADDLTCPYKPGPHQLF